jgi:hypothetical protein
MPGFGFVGAGHSASVVIGQDDDRPVFQFRVKDPFAGNVKIIAVHQGKNRHIKPCE